MREDHGRVRVALTSLTNKGTPQDVVNVLNLLIINFAKDSAEILSENKVLLERAAEILKNAAPSTRIEIGGHTDGDGDDVYNQELSEPRAVATRNELAKLGASPNVLIAKGDGEIAPRASSKTSEGRFENCRIEYKIMTVNVSSAAAQNIEQQAANTNSRK